MVGSRRRRPGRRGGAGSGSKMLESNNGQFSARDFRYTLCENEILCAFLPCFFGCVFLNVDGTKQ